ncbi:MAG TPA: hypothetical protein VIL57_03615 [Bacteroidia bacterium]
MRFGLSILFFILFLFHSNATHYYNREGEFVGAFDLMNPNVAFIDHDFNTGRDTIIEFDMTAREFHIIAKIIRLESLRGDADEVLYIAHTVNNRAKQLGTTMYNLLKSGYSSVKSYHKTELSPLDTSYGARNARAAVLDVLLGNPDPTMGATFWDGTDFLAWGLHSPNGTPQNKFEEYYCIEIPEHIYQAYLYNHLLRYKEQIVTYSRRTYEFPAEVFVRPENWKENCFEYNTGSRSPYRIEATATAGFTIFWKMYQY